jgi:hypothetical protein
MTDARPRCRSAPFCVAARTAASFARVNVAPLSCLALTRTSVLHLACQDPERCVGRHGKESASEDKALVTWTLALRLRRNPGVGRAVCDTSTDVRVLSCISSLATSRAARTCPSEVGIEGKAATTLKAALASTMQSAASLYEQVAERRGGTRYGRVDGGLVLRRRTTWPFKVPGSSSQARSREDRWFELNRNSEPYKLPKGISWISPTLTGMPRDGGYTLGSD